MIPEAVVPAELINVLIAVVFVAAVAMVLQAVFLFGAWRSSVAIKEQTTIIADHAESLVTSVQRAVEQSRKEIAEVTTKASDVLDLSHKQLLRIDGVLTEATTRAKVQMDRVELILDDTISRVHETVGLLQDGLLRPLREINSFAVGVRAALQHLVRGRRITVEQATHDDEMFI